MITSDDVAEQDWPVLCFSCLIDVEQVWKEFLLMIHDNLEAPTSKPDDVNTWECEESFRCI